MILYVWAILCLSSALCYNTKDPNYAAGRTTFVHLFEWKWNDIVVECEQFLGPYGYGGVQISPANENGIIWQPFWDHNVKRPWFERYQPVSYKIATRSGNEEELKNMVDKCNKAGVRIYVDMIFNHMTGHIGNGHGTGGSYFEPDNMRYDGVPYGPLDFTPRDRCNSKNGDISDYNDANQVRNCKLSGLNDLDIGKEYVRNKIVEYMNRLIGYGVAGFRIDAAKHMFPGDLQNVYNGLNNLNTTYFTAGRRPFIFQEVIDMGGEAIKSRDYTYLGRVTEFKYGKELGDVIRNNNQQKLKYLKNFGEGWGMLPSNDCLAFVDNHDNQRGHGSGGFGSIITHFDTRWYKMATAFMLSWPYGVTRVMSSYAWPRYINQDGKDINDWIGPPHDQDYNTKPVIRNADLSCGNGWICEHKWRQIYNMVRFRNVVGFSSMSHWWDNGDDQIAFGRGDRGFIAFNNDWRLMDVKLQTGLQNGTYCDVISGNKEGSRCTGKQVVVDNSGVAKFYLESNLEDSVMAIHVEAKL